MQRNKTYPASMLSFKVGGLSLLTDCRSSCWLKYSVKLVDQTVPSSSLNHLSYFSHIGNKINCS